MLDVDFILEESDLVMKADRNLFSCKLFFVVALVINCWYLATNLELLIME